MQNPESIFRDFLRAKKLKFTNERRAILSATQKFGRPFEAEELLLELRESEVRASKATLYRTLKHLLDSGLLKQVHFGGGKQAHYDFVNPASPNRIANLHLPVSRYRSGDVSHLLLCNVYSSVHYAAADL